MQKVLQTLLDERVSIRGLTVVLEALADAAGSTKDAEVLSEFVRQRLARQITKQRGVRSEESKLRKAYRKLEGVMGRSPSDAEVAEELGVSENELERLVSEMARGSVVSLDDLVTGMGDESTSLAEMTPSSPADDPYASQECGEAKRRLVKAIESLPEREKLVVSLYYFHDLTFKEIGKVLEITEQRVSQIHARVVIRLSHKLIRQPDLLATIAA